MKRILIVLTAILLMGVTPTLAVYGTQTKTFNCAADKSLPDSDCTPGAILTMSKSKICLSGYTKTVRAVTLAVKKKVFAEYDISYANHQNYEVDHLISLELGGSNDISNLWPEPTYVENGSLVKDKFENYLHKQVCGGKMTIQDAQNMISGNWIKYYLVSVNGNSIPSSNTQVPQVNQTQPTTTTPDVNIVPSDTAWPIGSTAKCTDGTFSSSVSRSGACSHHGGVSKWSN